MILGRLFRNLEEVRAAVTAFRDRYNLCLSPIRALVTACPAYAGIDL